jgi:hypothetical protein
MREADRLRKLALLEAPQIKSLTQLIRSWETKERRFPLVDPEDGGVEAKVLFLQHTPSSTAVRSGFVFRPGPARKDRSHLDLPLRRAPSRPMGSDPRRLQAVLRPYAGPREPGGLNP